MSGQRPLALVTGASSGIGQALAERLASDGYDLIVVARRGRRLGALAERLQAEHGVAVEALVADLTEPEDLARVEARVVQAAEERLTLLVNNAGFSGYGPFVEVEQAILERLMAIHVTTPVRLIRAALPGMLARAEGAVVDVASLLSLSGPLPMRMGARATYAAGKSFQLVFMQALAQELEDTGVQAMVCLPGMVESEFHGIRQESRPPGMPPLMSAADVAQAIVTGLARGEVVCVPGLEDAQPIFEQLRDLQQATLAGGNATGRLAARYRE